MSSGHTAQSRAWDEKQDGKSAPSPDHQDTRAHLKKPRNHAGSVVRQGTRTTPGQTPPLALEKDILGAFVADLCRAGVAGEEQLAQLEYLAITSRVLPWGRAGERPISVLAKGTSSTGKSFTTSTVLRFFPAEAWLDLGSMSRRLLFYTEEVFAHRFLIVPEWASIKDDEEVVAMLRAPVRRAPRPRNCRGRGPTQGAADREGGPDRPHCHDDRKQRRRRDGNPLPLAYDR